MAAPDLTIELNDINLAIVDEDGAAKDYTRLAGSLQAEVDKLPISSQQRRVLQEAVKDIRFIVADEARHKTILQSLKAALSGL